MQSIGKYLVYLPDEPPVELEVKYRTEEKPGHLCLFCKIIAYNKKYKIIYKFCSHVHRGYYAVPYEMEKYIKYAVQNNGVSFEFLDKNLQHLQICFDYVLECGKPDYTMVTLTAQDEKNLILERLRAENLTLKRKYAKLLKKVNTEKSGANEN